MTSTSAPNAKSTLRRRTLSSTGPANSARSGCDTGCRDLRAFSFQGGWRANDLDDFDGVGHHAGVPKVFFQDDGFSEKLRAGCKIEAECRQLALDAERRTITCRDNVVGYVRCDVARADKLTADAYVKPYDEVRERRATEERRTARHHSSMSVLEATQRVKPSRSKLLGLRFGDRELALH